MTSIALVCGSFHKTEVDEMIRHATAEAEEEWVETIKSYYDGLLIANTKSWFTGYNSNVDDHDKLRYLIFWGGAPKFRERITEVAENGYHGFSLQK